MPFDPNAQHLSNRDMDRMAEQAREAAREGRMDEAQQRMAELERMLDRLRNARAEHGRDGERTQAQRQRGRQQMGAVQDMIGRQGGLLDHSQGRVDETTRFRANRPSPAPTDENADREADRRVQQALRRALGELMQQFGDLTGEVPPSLSEADQAMRDAQKQLGEGNDKGAGASEQKAVEALQKGGREMGQAMARQFGPQQGQDGSEQEGDSDGQMGMTLQDGQSDSAGTRLAARPARSGKSGPRSARPPLRSGQFRRRRECRRDRAGGTGAPADAGDPAGAAPPRRRTRAAAAGAGLYRPAAEAVLIAGLSIWLASRSVPQPAGLHHHPPAAKVAATATGQ